MSSNVNIGQPAGANRTLGDTTEAVKRPNVVGVGAWLSRAKAMREAVTVYVPRHRAAGPAV